MIDSRGNDVIQNTTYYILSQKVEYENCIYVIAQYFMLFMIQWFNAPCFEQLTCYNILTGRWLWPYYKEKAKFQFRRILQGKQKCLLYKIIEFRSSSCFKQMLEQAGIYESILDIYVKNIRYYK